MSQQPASHIFCVDHLGAPRVVDRQDLRILDETVNPDDPDYNPNDPGMKQVRYTHLRRAMFWLK
jgi:hypothetical protein